MSTGYQRPQLDVYNPKMKEFSPHLTFWTCAPVMFEATPGVAVSIENALPATDANLSFLVCFNVEAKLIESRSTPNIPSRSEVATK